MRNLLYLIESKLFSENLSMLFTPLYYLTYIIREVVTILKSASIVVRISAETHRYKAVDGEKFSLSAAFLY